MRIAGGEVRRGTEATPLRMLIAVSTPCSLRNHHIRRYNEVVDHAPSCRGVGASATPFSHGGA